MAHRPLKAFLFATCTTPWQFHTALLLWTMPSDLENASDRPWQTAQGVRYGRVHMTSQLAARCLAMSTTSLTACIISLMRIILRKTGSAEGPKIHASPRLDRPTRPRSPDGLRSAASWSLPRWNGYGKARSCGWCSGGPEVAWPPQAEGIGAWQRAMPGLDWASHLPCSVVEAC